MRRLRTAAVAIGVIGLSGALLASARAASAACVAGPLPLGTVQGVITAESAGDRFYQTFTLVADDGSTWTVAVATPKGKNDVIEDMWLGRVPQVGGRYRVVGGAARDKSLFLNQCAQGSVVEVLAPPPSTAPASQAPSPVGKAVSDWLVPVIGAGVLVVLSVALARRARHR